MHLTDFSKCMFLYHPTKQVCVCVMTIRLNITNHSCATLLSTSERSHSAYRVYMSAEPAPTRTPDSHIIPQVCSYYVQLIVA